MTEEKNNKPNPFEEDKTKWVIRSFVRHQGRLTQGQRDALDNHWQQFGIDLTDNKLDISSFGFTKVIFELGFGYGESFIQMAKESPDTLFIGAEVHRPGIGRALLLAQENKLKNVKIFDGDAIEFIDKMLDTNSIDRVQIYFPDPWHKKRHFKRRLIQPDFCKKINRILKNKGILHIATDWVPYAEHCIEVTENLSFFKNIAGSHLYVDKPSYRP